MLLYAAFAFRHLLRRSGPFRPALEIGAARPRLQREGLLVMARRSLVVFCAAENLAHEVLQFGRFLMRSAREPVSAGVERKVREERSSMRCQRQPSDRVSPCDRQLGSPALFSKIIYGYSTRSLLQRHSQPHRSGHKDRAPAARCRPPEPPPTAPRSVPAECLQSFFCRRRSTMCHEPGIHSPKSGNRERFSL
jgi:hypothetical protein